jgi:hypothetical protein
MVRDLPAFSIPEHAQPIPERIVRKLIGLCGSLTALKQARRAAIQTSAEELHNAAAVPPCSRALPPPATSFRARPRLSIRFYKNGHVGHRSSRDPMVTPSAQIRLS